MVGWPFFFRQQHRQVTGRLRVTVPTVLGIGKFATSPYASLPCRNHFIALRWQRSARFPGQAPSRKLWHDRLALGCTSRAALAMGYAIGCSRLTVHSSRTRFASRLNSRVRRRRVGWLAVLLSAATSAIHRSAPGSSSNCSWHPQARRFALRFTFLPQSTHLTSAATLGKVSRASSIPQAVA